MIKSYPSMFIYTTIILLSLSMIISSNNWFFSWMGLEFSLFGFLPLFSTNAATTEASMKYYLMQTSGSTMFIMSFLLTSKGAYILTTLGMMMKLGIFPFFQWIPIVMTGLTWWGCAVLTTIQKMGPLMITLNMVNINPTILLSTLSIMISSILGFNQTLMRPLMAYSSITHTSWMLLTTMVSIKLMIVYMIFYFMLVLLLFNSFYNKKIEKVMTATNLKNPLMMQSILILMLAGIPPFSIFFLKFNVIFSMINIPMIVFILIISTFVSTYYYLTFTIPNLMHTVSKESPKTGLIMVTHMIPITSMLCHKSASR